MKETVEKMRLTERDSEITECDCLVDTHRRIAQLKK